MLQEKEADPLKAHVLSSLSVFYHYRKEMRNRFPNFWDLRVVKKPLEVLREELKGRVRILDIGAGNREIGRNITTSLPVKEYKSMDVDKSSFHDFYSWDDIRERFDVVFLFEVLEHLDLDEGIELLEKIYSVLDPKGKLFLTTPNLAHPNRYWACHHKTPYRYDELGAILLAVGLEPLHIYRMYNDSFLARAFRIHVGGFLHRYLQVDFAPSIMLVAQRNT